MTRRHLQRALAVAAILTLAGAGAWWLFDPHPTSDARFDRGRNGLWIGHQWYTGLNVRTGAPVGADERARLLTTLRRQRIGWAFVHAGPVQSDGSVEDEPGGFFFSLRADAPEVTFLPWLGAGTSDVAVDRASWRSAFINTLEGLRALDLHGVHLDFEPIEDEDEGYLRLLEEMRTALGSDYTISHATRRAGPWGMSLWPMDRWFWSGAFYRSTMKHADQTVLMAYDTTLDTERAYVGFVRHQTNLLLTWGCAQGGHRILIGIPSYEDVPHLSNPDTENIRNASLGVRAALEASSSACFDGVAIYAEWVTDDAEWESYRTTWLGE